MSFTVVTVLHDSAAHLPALFDSLALLAQPPQVVAVDTASGDDGPSIARERGAELVVLRNNPGFGAANNAGVARARHPVTLLLNPDCALLDAGVTTLVEIAAARDALVAPGLVGRDGRRQRVAHPLPGTAGALLPALVHPPLLPRALRDRAEPWRAQRARSAGWAIAACLAGRTQTLRALGPFDPSAFLFYEDMDLCLRARARGIPTIFVPEVAVRHAGGHSTQPAYGGEPHALLARRRREVVRANRGRGAAALDDTAQILTFATRTAARRLLGRETTRARQQLAAQLGLRS